MNMVVCAVKDVRLGEFLPPYVAPNLAMAERMFSDAVRAENSPFFKNPDDYVLYKLCEWESEKGTFGLEDIVVMRYARDFVKE